MFFVTQIQPITADVTMTTMTTKKTTIKASDYELKY